MGSIATAGESNPFLDADLLVRTALSAGADAIHPGYGYLSENPDFADKVRAAGLIFLGPSSVAMGTLGNKRASKVYLHEKAPEVPLIPGFAGSSQNLDALEAAAHDIGFPVMLKASAGGGGKGMRIVYEPNGLRGELQRAQSEAKRSFGSEDCILEKYIEAGKHVEFQILGDSHGRVVSLWDRDCSVQRRHQKVIEEAPCPWLSNDMRKRMSASAVRIAELIGYEGAGTVEFIVDIQAEKYYFLEVNARLQVEHPITEEVTGVDLVSLQLFVATGGRLDDLPPLYNIPQHGHAIEARLCAEDANRDFFPEQGMVRLWLPAAGELGPGRDIRYETHMQTGSKVSIYFDPLVAKIIVWAPNRYQAIRKLLKVLANTACVGVRTNQLFLQSCLRHPSFWNPAYTTSFIPDNIKSLLQNPYDKDGHSICTSLAVIPCFYLRSLRGISSPTTSNRAFRNIRPGFRNQRFDHVNRPVNVIVSVPEGTKGDAAEEQESLFLWEPVEGTSLETFDVHLKPIPRPELTKIDRESVANEVTARYNAISSVLRNGRLNERPAQRVVVNKIARVPGPEPADSSHWPSSIVSASINDSKVICILSTQPSHDDSTSSQAGQPQIVYAHTPSLGTWTEYRVYSILSFAESKRGTSIAATEGNMKFAKAPMPCKVLRILKKEGDQVKKGENVMVVESMKMEMSIALLTDGKFTTGLRVGDTVDEGVVLCEAC